MSACVRCDTTATRKLLPLEFFACSDCHTIWIREESCSVESVESAVGTFNGTGYAAHMKRFVAELLKRTEAWALAWRAAA
jgi:hypothetical protein